MPTGLTPQIRSGEEFARASSDLLSRRETVRTLAEYISTVKGFPELRGFWTFGSINESGNALDESGQGRTLTNNSATARGVYDNVVPYADMDGVADYFSRPDEAGLDITADLTLGGWFWFDSIATSNLIGKQGGAGQFGYLLVYNNTIPAFQMATSSTGASHDFVVTATAGGAPSAGRWYFLVGKFIPSTSISIFINGTKYIRTSGPIASSFNNTAPFAVGAGSSPASNFINGRSFGCFLCAASLSDNLIQLVYHRSKSLFGLTC